MTVARAKALEALAEANRLSPTEPIRCVVSVGWGSRARGNTSGSYPPGTRPL